MLTLYQTTATTRETEVKAAISAQITGRVETEKHLSTGMPLLFFPLKTSFLTSFVFDNLVIESLKEVNAARVIAETSCAKTDDRLRDVNNARI
jgi:hypothetical protein